MRLEYVPLLAIQRDLYRLPRGAERFREYLRTMIDPATEDLRLPLVAMNPMGKDHLPAFLDAAAAIDADQVGARATTEAAASLANDPGSFRVGLVVADDLRGGWTNRSASELAHRRGNAALVKRGWITGILWTSESYAPEQIREEVLTTIFRTAHISRRGPARTLGELLAQEGGAMRRAGARKPTFAAAELETAFRVVEPLLKRDDMATAIAVLFGDAAATELGYKPLGLALGAGLALAFDERFDAG